MAQVLGRSPSTISRELRSNAHPKGYASTSARVCAQQRRRHGRAPGKLHQEGILFALVRHFLSDERWSPEQIALTLAAIHAKGHEYRVSHETIYHCIYAQPVGELKRELVAALRHAHNKRVPRSKGKDRRGQIAVMVSIHLRPPDIEERQFPGHWEGDLVKGAGSASAVGTLVERTSRLLILVKLAYAQPASAASVLQGFTDKLLGIAAPMRLSMTYDQGREMAMHKELSLPRAWRCTSVTRTVRGSAAPTRTPTGWYANICPRAQTYRVTARSSLTRLPIRSTTDLVKVSVYDPRWRSIERSCLTARNIQPSFIESQSVALHT